MQQMVEAEASCPRCHFHGDTTKLKFQREVGCPTVSKNGYVCHKDKAAAEVKFAEHFHRRGRGGHGGWGGHGGRGHGGEQQKSTASRATSNYADSRSSWSQVAQHLNPPSALVYM